MEAKNKVNAEKMLENGESEELTDFDIMKQEKEEQVKELRELATNTQEAVSFETIYV